MHKKEAGTNGSVIQWHCNVRYQMLGLISYDLLHNTTEHSLMSSNNLRLYDAFILEMNFMVSLSYCQFFGRIITCLDSEDSYIACIWQSIIPENKEHFKL